MSQSALDQMVSSVMARKEAKATGLTPVGAERQPVLHDAPGDRFEYERGVREQIVVSLAVVRSEMAKIEEACRSVEREAGIPEGGPPPFVTPVAAAEAASAEGKVKDATADEEHRKFTEDIAAKSAAAQAQAFAAQDDPAPKAGSSWVCPAHGTESVTMLTSRKGRKYGSCTRCQQFERS